MPYITIAKAGCTARDLSLAGPIITIGRDPRNDIHLDDSLNHPSRFHAAFVSAPGGSGYFIRDLSSVRGTRLNGEATYQSLLKDADIIEIASYSLTYRELAIGRRQPRLRLIAHPEANPNAPTALMKSPFMESASDRGEILQELELRGAGSRCDFRSFLHAFLPATVRAIGADRGLVAIFDATGFEEICVVNLDADDQIGVSTPDVLDRIRRGCCVRDGTVLFAPVRWKQTVIGFFCVDRVASLSPFDDKDERFLIRVGRLAIPEYYGQNASSRPRSIPWPSVIVGKSQVLQDALRKVDEASQTNATVLILGETGTGKELIARAIHEHSCRRHRPFVKVNCAAIPAGLLESELFGHEKGAFTGAVAQQIGRLETSNGGSLFLDEIGEIPLELQPKLLRALQEHEFERLGSSRTVRIDSRLIAATNRDLSVMVNAGEYRSDLFYRLNVFPIHLPPLRARREDIRLLAHCFLDTVAYDAEGTVARVMSQRALQLLMEYNWPGNIRELQNCMSACARNYGDVLFSWRLPAEIREQNISSIAKCLPSSRLRPMHELEREKILEALTVLDGNITRAAAALGFSRQGLLNKMDAFGIARERLGLAHTATSDT